MCEWIDLGLRIFTAAFAAGSFTIAFIALSTWKKQIKLKPNYDAALAYEASFTKLAMHTSGEQTLQGNDKLESLGYEIASNYFLLLQRDFMVDETKKLYDTFHEIMEHFRNQNSASVPESLHMDIVSNLNLFSLALRKAL